jgi:hypothetical protein
LRSFFGYKKIKRRDFLISHYNFCYIFFNLVNILFKKFYTCGSSSVAFKKILKSLLFFKKDLQSDFMYVFLSFVDNLRLPFLLRSKKVAGRLYQIPMVTSLDAQYNQVIRNLIKISHNQKYRVFFPYLFFHLKLAYLNQSFFYTHLLNLTTTASDNIRFVRFR